MSADSSAGNIQSNQITADRSGGSNPPPRTKFAAKWREELSCITGTYLQRWYIETPFFSIRLHHWLHSDDDRHLHDHPWNFITIILKGSYTDVSENGKELMHIGKIAYRSATHKHYVKIDKDCWTILFTGPKIRKWGFWIGERFRKANKYFFMNGPHTCD